MEVKDRSLTAGGFYANNNQAHLIYREIDNTQLFKYAKNTLPLHGTLQYNEIESYCYLDIHDDFIFKLFPLIKEDNIYMPNYFPPEDTTGAHISIIYPNELCLYPNDIPPSNLKINEINQNFDFEITGLIAAHILNKTFYALTVSSLPLEQLRIQYSLPIKLNYRGFLVPFHITIGVKFESLR